MSRVIGIDLGTTNSCVAVVEGTGPRVIPCRTGQPTTPSVVATTDSGKRLVGHLAKRQAITNAANTVFGAKRLIGRRFADEDVQKALGLASFASERGPHDDIRVTMGGKHYAIAEIASMVLQELRLVAERALGESVSKAVITVPAYFNDNQRQATKDAGRIAGLEVLRIINEPTAAALAYGFNKDLEQRVVVYDFGGGTFDISVLEIGQGVFEVLATAGDTFLGGEDFDERIIAWLAEQFRAQHGVDLREDKMALQRLRDAAEKAKIELSDAVAVDVNLPFIHSCEAQGGGGVLHLQAQLAREQVNALVDDLVKRTIDICDRAMTDARVDGIDAVILVGGMTRMPLVQQEVQSFFGIPPSKGVHPDEVVACGAAIQGHLLTKGGAETLLLDVTPHDLGIMVAGGRFDILIEKGTTIPTHANKIFTTTRDGQTQVRIVVLQGDSTAATNNELLGEFLLDKLRHAPKGEVKIEVTFDISADGIMGVSARDLETGRKQQIKVTATSGLTEHEIAAMSAENEEVARSLEVSDALETERLEVERLIREIERLLPEVFQLVEATDFGHEALKKANDAASEARDAISRRDKDALAGCKSTLGRTLSFLANVQEKQLGR